GHRNVWNGWSRDEKSCLGSWCGTSSSKNLMPRRKVWGCPLTPRLMAKPRKPLRVSASMSMAISTTCVPAIALTPNRVSPCETRKTAPYFPFGGCNYGRLQEFVECGRARAQSPQDTWPSWRHLGFRDLDQIALPS